jgi:hypothetical protein
MKKKRKEKKRDDYHCNCIEKVNRQENYKSRNEKSIKKDEKE